MNAEQVLATLLRIEELLVRLRPIPATYLLRFPYNSGIGSIAAHMAAARFHPDARFAWWSITTGDWALMDRCRDDQVLNARCQALCDRIGANPTLAGSIILLHDSPFDVTHPLRDRVGEILLPMLLTRLRDRHLQAGPLRTPPRDERFIRWRAIEPRLAVHHALTQARRVLPGQRRDSAATVPGSLPPRRSGLDVTETEERGAALTSVSPPRPPRPGHA